LATGGKYTFKYLSGTFDKQDTAHLIIDVSLTYTKIPDSDFWDSVFDVAIPNTIDFIDSN